MRLGLEAKILAPPGVEFWQLGDSVARGQSHTAMVTPKKSIYIRFKLLMLILIKYGLEFYP